MAMPHDHCCAHWFGHFTLPHERARSTAMFTRLFKFPQGVCSCRNIAVGWCSLFETTTETSKVDTCASTDNPTQSKVRAQFSHCLCSTALRRPGTLRLMLLGERRGEDIASPSPRCAGPPSLP